MRLSLQHVLSSHRAISLVLGVGFAALFLVLAPANAQTTGDITPGFAPYQSFQGGDIDSINLFNGNLVLHIPLLNYPQRGTSKLSFSLLYNSKANHTTQTCLPPPAPKNCTDFWIDGVGPGVIEDNRVHIVEQSFQLPNQGPTQSEFAVVTADGAQHPLMGSGTTGQLTGDATGFWSNSSFQSTAPPPTVIIDKNGVRHFISSTAGVLREDPNGNQISIGSDGATLTDTMGRAVVFSGANPGSSTTNFTGCTGPLPISSATVWTVPSVSGGTMQIKFCQVTLTVNIPAHGAVLAAGGPFPMLQSIVLPNGTAWTFQYNDRDSTDPASVNYGTLTEVTLPTGGTISYTYALGTGTPCSSFPSLSRDVTSRVVDAHDGSGPHTWQYSSAGKVTDPLGNDVVHTFTDVSPATTPNCTFFETNTKFYQGSSTSGTLLKTVQTDYNYFDSGNDVFNSPGVVPIRATTTWANGQVTKNETDYDFNFPGNITYGEIIAKREFDYATGSNTPPLLRQTKTTYQAFAGSNTSSYLANNLIQLPFSVQVLNGAGTQVALTQYNFDGTSPANSGLGSAQHLDTNPAGGLFRGNLTSVQRWLNSGTLTCPNGHSAGTNSMVTSNSVFFNTGEIQSSTDPCGNTTSYLYSSTYEGAYPTTITNALSQSTTRAYDFNTGLPTATLDQNDINASRAGTTVSYDALNRPVTTSFPDGGQTTNCYTDLGGSGCVQSGPPYNVVTTTKIDSSQNKVQTTTFDGLGRPTQTQLAFDTSYTATTYDALGRVYAVYNPTHCNPPTTYCGESTWGYTAYSYDALNRVTSVRQPDTLTVTTSYSGNCATVTDEAGKSRKSCSDGLGRLTSVSEDPAGQNIQTTYSYDALDNLTSVVQNGSRNRTFAYDSLARLTSATNPESGTITYTYDPNSNLLTRKDARNITTTYTYDALNRNTLKSYSDGTPSASLVYDSVSLTGVAAPQNPVGRLVYASTSTTGTVLSYDPLGRVLTKIQCTPLNCGSGWLGMNYTYDANGDMITYTNAGWGYTFTQGFDANGRFYNLSTNWVDATHPSGLAYADWRTTSPYAPNGALRSLLVWNNLEENTAYNNRLQPCRINVNSTNTMLFNCADAVPSGNVVDFQMGFNLGASDNGNVASWSATGAQTFNRTYTYDSFNRLSSMADSATGQACKGLSWTYDVWGNRTAQTTTAGACLQPPAVSVNTNNQLVAPYLYDAAGNMTFDGSHHYAYDAENRLTQVDPGTTPTATYVYDAFGQRARKTAGTYLADYFYNAEGPLDTIVENTHSSRGYVYVNGRLVVEYANGTTYFVHQDHLGSTRLLSSYPTPTIAESDDYYPFGELNASGTISFQKFTGKERDSESGLDNFAARYYGSSFGRFPSPDPANAGAVVDHPQSWNAYSYVLNNPLIYVDPTGRECVWDDGSYDSEHDKDTGSVGACQYEGGTWVELGQNDGWSSFQNDSLHNLVDDIQNGNANIATAIGVDGNPYATLYDSQGRVSETVFGGSITQYSYFPGENEVVPSGNRSWADPNGALASGLRQWTVSHPGLPLNSDDRQLLFLKQYLEPLNRPPSPCDSITISQSASQIATQFFPQIAVDGIDKVYNSLGSYWNCNQ
jgi:RHS repeat-associated protein